MFTGTQVGQVEKLLQLYDSNREIAAVQSLIGSAIPQALSWSPRLPIGTIVAVVSGSYLPNSDPQLARTPGLSVRFRRSPSCVGSPFKKGLSQKKCRTPKENLWPPRVDTELIFR